MFIISVSRSGPGFKPYNMERQDSYLMARKQDKNDVKTEIIYHN